MAFKPTVFGKYHLVDKIAEGGMAEVFRAKTYGVADFEKTVVIKRILPHITQESEFVKMFIDEARVVATLNHNNIVAVYDFGSINRAYYLAMEFVHGSNLNTLMEDSRQAGKRFPIAHAVFIASEICHGLDYAHNMVDNQGRPLLVVHRDVSPKNILIAFGGEVKLTDFGVAKTASQRSQTMSGMIKGNVAYMSPEQAMGHDIMDRRSDIFSIGIVIYEMLTGGNPFAAEMVLDTLENIKGMGVTPPSQYNNRIPFELDQIVLRALEKDADRRFQSAGEMAIALRNLLFSSLPTYSARSLAEYLDLVYPPTSPQRALSSDPPPPPGLLQASEDAARAPHSAIQPIPQGGGRRRGSTSPYPDQDSWQAGEITNAPPQQWSRLAVALLALLSLAMIALYIIYHDKIQSLVQGQASAMAKSQTLQARLSEPVIPLGPHPGAEPSGDEYDPCRQ